MRLDVPPKKSTFYKPEMHGIGRHFIASARMHINPVTLCLCKMPFDKKHGKRFFSARVLAISFEPLLNSEWVDSVVFWLPAGTLPSWPMRHADALAMTSRSDSHA